MIGLATHLTTTTTPSASGAGAVNLKNESKTHGPSPVFLARVGKENCLHDRPTVTPTNGITNTVVTSTTATKPTAVASVSFHPSTRYLSTHERFFNGILTATIKLSPKACMANWEALHL